MKKILQFIINTIIPLDPKILKIERSGFSPPCLYVSPNGIISFYSYKDSHIRIALIEIKDRPNKTIAHMLGKSLFEGIKPIISRNHENNGRYLIMPIPITTKKKRLRGWNQCELMLGGFKDEAKRAGLFENLEIRTDILIKIRETDDQVGKSKSQRFENLKDCFAVTESALLRDRNIIVFDDITTTGATLIEARKVLEQNGAQKIICLSIAH